MSTPRRIHSLAGHRAGTVPAPGLAVGPREVTDYEEHRAYVLSVLGRRASWLDAGDREALLHDAYVVLLEKQRSGELSPAAMRPAQVRAYLTQTALNKALDVGKSAGRRRSVPIEHEDGRPLEIAAPDAEVSERVIALDDHRRLRGLVAELPTRQRDVLALRYWADREPDEVRAALALNSRQYRRDLERGKRALGERLSAQRAACEVSPPRAA